jgi:3-hydroxybutyryl-CoA dehydrogenase
MNRTITNVAVIGAGYMGSGIAQTCAQAGFTVTLIDSQKKALETAAKRMTWSVEKFAAKGKLDEGASAVLARLTYGTDLTLLASADLVIEAIYENREAKEAVLRAAETAAPSAILGSNTSTIPITLLAECLARPEHFLGIHFFGPVPLMKLVEVIRGDATSDTTLDTIVAFTRSLGKNPVIVNKDVPGFIMNRLLGAMAIEAIRLVEDGIAAVDDVDEGMCDGFNLRIGPLAICDNAGLDICLNAFRVMHDLDPERMAAPPALLERLVADGKLGAKSGEGFYTYDAQGKRIAPTL